MITLALLPLIPAAHAVTISMNIPGTSTNSTSTPGAYIANFYQFALMIGGVLAFGVIVYGGVKYMASAGNPSGQGDAKEWVEAALLGLLLLVGAYFILDVINPQLLNLNLPSSLPAVNIQTTNPAPSPSPSPSPAPAPSDCSPACVAPATCQLSGNYDIFAGGGDTYSCQ